MQDIITNSYPTNTLQLISCLEHLLQVQANLLDQQFEDIKINLSVASLYIFSEGKGESTETSLIEFESHKERLKQLIYHTTPGQSRS